MCQTTDRIGSCFFCFFLSAPSMRVSLPAQTCSGVTSWLSSAVLHYWKAPVPLWEAPQKHRSLHSNTGHCWVPNAALRSAFLAWRCVLVALLLQAHVNIQSITSLRRWDNHVEQRITSASFLSSLSLHYSAWTSIHCSSPAKSMGCNFSGALKRLRVNCVRVCWGSPERTLGTKHFLYETIMESESNNAKLKYILKRYM